MINMNFISRITKFKGDERIVMCVKHANLRSTPPSISKGVEYEELTYC